MIDQIKTIIRNYLNNAKIPVVIEGTKTSDGVKISDELTVPDELVYIPTWLKDPAAYPKTETAGEDNHKHEFKQHIEVATGDRLYMLRNLGGQLFFVLDVIKNERTVN